MPLTRRHLLGAALGATTLGATHAQGSAPAFHPLATGLDSPWSLAFLPDGSLLVTERPGRMRLVASDGRLSAPLAGLPPVVARGQGGLLDVVLHPEFARNALVYWSYSEPAPEGGVANSTAVARARLDARGLRLVDVQPVFRQQPKFPSNAHFGSRLAFARDGKLFITLGDRFNRRDDAQDLGNHHGKVVRVNDDGSVPADNPFAQRPGARPEIWSYGHRNVQGAAIHPATGALWTHEHGPQGGDELNISRAGRNYGWPVITRGREYGLSTRIGEGETRADVEPALTTWVPSIAPCGMAFVTGDRHPAWRGQLLVGALKARALLRLELDGERVVRETRYPVDGRVRDVRQGPDGRLLLLTDEGSDSAIVRIEPR
jgi:glucose/arabinose dehydrogenase